MVWMMWLVVFFIFHWSVHSGMCFAASWSAKADRVSKYSFWLYTMESI